MPGVPEEGDTVSDSMKLTFQQVSNSNHLHIWIIIITKVNGLKAICRCMCVLSREN